MSARTTRQGARDQLLQVQVEALLDEDALHAQGGAPQPEGILGAGGLLADGEDAGERVELVGDRHRDAGAARGQLIARAARQVVLADRLGDLGRLAVGARVVACP